MWVVLLALYSAEWKKSTEFVSLKEKKKKAAVSTGLFAGLSKAYVEKIFEDKLMDK